MEVRLVDLTKEFEDILAVDRVNIKFPDEELTSLLGPSGCGKTSTLRCISGFYEPTEGQVYLGDQVVNDIPPDKRDVATVFQSLAIFPHMTIGENVGYGLRVRGETKDAANRVQDMLHTVGLGGLENRYPEKLSGGQRQRVALARALILLPKALLLDEPLSDLDKKLKVEMRTEIRKLQQEFGITMVYVTHDQEEAMSISDKLAVMNQGRIEQIGKPSKVYQQPSTEFVIDFIGKATYIPGTLSEVGENQKSGWVNTKIGKLEFKLDNPLEGVAEGDKAKLALRPSVIKIVKNSDKTSNTITGKVVVNMFLGDQVRTEVDVGLGDNIICDTSNVETNSRISSLVSGDKVTLSIPVDSVKLLVRGKPYS